MKSMSLVHPARLHASRLALVLAVPLIVGCGKKETPVVAADTQAVVSADAGAPTPPPKPDDGSPGEGNPRRDPEPAAKPAASTNTLAAPALGRVPKDAPFVVTVHIKDMLSALGYAELLAKHGLMLAELSGPMVEVAGHNFFELESWSKIGIDLAAPAGFFGIDYRTNGGVLFLGVSDRKVLETFIVETAKKAGTEMTVEKVGEHSLLSIAGENRGAVLLTENAVYSVNLFRGTGAIEIARSIGTRELSDSILGSEEWKTLSSGVASPDGGVYVRLTELLSRPLAGGDDARLLADIENRIEEAKKAGDAELVENLTRELGFMKESVASMAKRAVAEQELFNKLTSGMSQVVAGLDFSPEGIDVDIRAPLAAGALLSNLLKSSDGIVPIMKVAGSTPLFSIGGKVDVAAAVELLALMLATEGDDMAELRTELKSQFGVDLDTDILANLGGDIGFALTGDLGEILRSGDPASVMGGTFILGLKNPDALKAAFAKLAAMPGMSELGTWDDATSSFSGKLPEGRAFVISLNGSWLVASTDPEAKGRIEGQASFVDTLGNPVLKTRLSKPGLGAYMQFQQGFVGGWLFMAGGRSSSFPEPESPNEPEEKKKIREELAKLQAEIGPLRAKVEEARMKPLLDSFGKLGNFAQTARLADGALAMTMGIYPQNATLAEAVGGFVGYAVDQTSQGAPTPDEEKLRELENLRWELESKLWRAEPRAIEPEPAPAPGD